MCEEAAKDRIYSRIYPYSVAHIQTKLTSHFDRWQGNLTAIVNCRLQIANKKW